MVNLVLTRPNLINIAEQHWSRSVPLGLGYLAAVARQKGLSVKVVDGKALGHIHPDQTAAAILSHRPEMVGISALTVEYPSAKKIAQILKTHATNPITVLGGAHANALPEECLKESPEFDFLLAGESENSLQRLFRELSASHQLDNIPGLYQRQADGSIINIVPPEYNADLDQMPFPAWDLFAKNSMYPIMTERGCPFKCVFCSHNMTRKVRSRSVLNVVEELHWLRKNFQPSIIRFEDETFGTHPQRTEELLEHLIRINEKSTMLFGAQTRVDCISPKILQLMRRAGFQYLELGVESGDPEVLARSGKGIKLSQVESAVLMAKKVGIRVWLKFIIGLPGETMKTVRRSIDLAVRLNPDILSVSRIVAYPGSAIYQWALKGEQGYRLLSYDWQRFDKYLDVSIKLDNLSNITMQLLQIQMYGETYLRNFRFGEFIRLITAHRNIAFAMLRQLLRQSHCSQ